MRSKDIVFGLRPLIETIQAGREIEKVMIQKGLHGEILKELRSLIEEREIPYQFVPPERLKKFGNVNHQGVVALISSISYTQIEQVIPIVYEQGKTPLILILDRITDVRNFGAVARTAECAGVHAIVIPSKGAALIGADAMKTSAGALAVVPVCRTPSLTEAVTYLKESGLQVYGATEKTSSPYFDVSFKEPTAIILGSEEDGISGDLLQLCDEKIRIPTMGSIASLNVSVSAGILVYEALRQRKGD